MQKVWAVVLFMVFTGCATTGTRPADAKTDSAAAVEGDAEVNADANANADVMADGADGSGEDQLVCRDREVVGSHIPQRTCTTKRKARLSREAAQRVLENQERVNRKMGN